LNLQSLRSAEGVFVSTLVVKINKKTQEFKIILKRITEDKENRILLLSETPEITRYHSNRGVSSVSRCAADLEIAERL